MSFKLVDCVLRLTLPMTERYVLLLLAKYSDQHGRCFPSTRTLARDGKLNRRTVLRALERLETCGHLVVTRRHRRLNHYRIALQPDANNIASGALGQPGTSNVASGYCDAPAGAPESPQLYQVRAKATPQTFAASRSGEGARARKIAAGGRPAVARRVARRWRRP